MKKNIPQSRISNSYWLSNLKKYSDYEEDYDAAYESAVNAVTSEAVVALVKAIMAQGNFIQVSLSPAQ